MALRPTHLDIYRPGVWNGYGVKSSHASSGGITPVGQRDPNHLYRAGYWDNYGAKGQGTTGSGAGGKGGKKAKKKKKGKHVKYSRHPIAAAALHDVWGHRGMAGGQG